MASNGTGDSQLDALAPLLPVALGLLGEGSELAQLKSGLREWAKQDPIDALLATVLGGGIAFYLAERHTNAACKNPWDGILYMASSMTLGSADTTPTTPTGLALATFVKSFGPSLTIHALDAPAADARAVATQHNAVQLAILERLDRIVQLLEHKPA